MEQEKKMPDQAMIVSSQKHYSEEGLWEKVKSVAKKAGLKVIYLALSREMIRCSTTFFWSPTVEGL